MWLISYLGIRLTKSQVSRANKTGIYEEYIVILIFYSILRTPFQFSLTIRHLLLPSCCSTHCPQSTCTQCPVALSDPSSDRIASCFTFPHLPTLFPLYFTFTFKFDFCILQCCRRQWGSIQPHNYSNLGNLFCNFIRNFFCNLICNSLCNTICNLFCNLFCNLLCNTNCLVITTSCNFSSCLSFRYHTTVETARVKQAMLLLYNLIQVACVQTQTARLQVSKSPVLAIFQAAVCK